MSVIILLIILFCASGIGGLALLIGIAIYIWHHIQNTVGFLW